MKIEIYPDYNSLSRETADRVANYIHKKPDSIVCLASGSTPVLVFKYLVEDCHAGKLDISRCTFVGLDEWLGIDKSLEGSCRNMMDRDFFRPLHIEESKIKFFDGMSRDPKQECERINRFIASRGCLDIMLVGVGLNGHIAMNEPGTPVDLYAHVGELAEETKVVGQKYFPKQTALSKGLTLGLRHWSESKLPILMANGSKKASIIQRALTPPPDPGLPASLVQSLAHSLVMLDKEAASLIEG